MRVVFAGGRQQDRDDGRRAALRTGLECAAADCVPLTDLRLRLSRDPQPHLIVAYFGPEPEAELPLLRPLVERVGPPVFAVADGPAEAAATALGVRGVWRPGELREGLLTAVEELRKAGLAPDTRGRVIAVTAAYPGAGVTTVAAGLAFALPDPKAVGLVELTGVPELALDLDLKPRHSVGNLIRERERLDAGMVRAAAVAHPSGVSVVAYPPAAAAEPLTPAAARDFQIVLRAAFPWTVVDAGGGPNAGALGLLALADAVVLVTRLDPPGLRLTRQYQTALADAGVPADALVVAANRYGQSGLVPWKKAEEALRTTVRAWLPDDPGAVNGALLAGRPLAETAGRSGLVKALRKLGSEIQTGLTPPR